MPASSSPREVLVQRLEQIELVADRQLDIDALDGVGVLAQPLERNDHVLVDLERVGVLGDRGRAGAVEPEFAARLGAHGDEAFAAARVGEAHHMRRSRRATGDVILADDVAEQHHLRQRAALRLGRVADGAQIALVQMLEPGEQRAPRRLGARRRGSA